MSSSDFHRHCMYVVHRHLRRQNTYTHKIKKLKRLPTGLFHKFNFIYFICIYYYTEVYKVIFIQPHNFVWLCSQHITGLLHLPFPLDLHSFFFHGICMFMTSCLYIKSRTHKWVKTYGTCFSQTGLIFLTWLPQNYSLACKWHTPQFSFGMKTIPCCAFI